MEREREDVCVESRAVCVWGRAGQGSRKYKYIPPSGVIACSFPPRFSLRAVRESRLYGISVCIPFVPHVPIQLEASISVNPTTNKRSLSIYM